MTPQPKFRYRVQVQYYRVCNVPVFNQNNRLRASLVEIAILGRIYTLCFVYVCLHIYYYVVN